jgi:hypothetical protein
MLYGIVLESERYNQRTVNGLEIKNSKGSIYGISSDPNIQVDAGRGGLPPINDMKPNNYTLERLYDKK